MTKNNWRYLSWWGWEQVNGLFLPWPYNRTPPLNIRGWRRHTHPIHDAGGTGSRHETQMRYYGRWNLRHKSIRSIETSASWCSREWSAHAQWEVFPTQNGTLYVEKVHIYKVLFTRDVRIWALKKVPCAKRRYRLQIKSTPYLTRKRYCCEMKGT